MSLTALEVNLRRTAAPVVIPDDQQFLLDIVASYFGIHQELERLLREINHPQVGWLQTLPELRFFSLNHFDHFNRDARGAEAIAHFCRFYARALCEARTRALRQEALRDSVGYLERIVEASGPHLERNQAPVLAALDGLGDVLLADEGLAIFASARLKRLCEILLRAGPQADAATSLAAGLLRDSLRQVFALWLGLEDPADWLRSRGLLAPGIGHSTPLKQITHHSLTRAASRLPAGSSPAPDELRLMLELPDQAQIERIHIEMAAHLGVDDTAPRRASLASTEWLFRVLGLAPLQAVHEPAIREITTHVSRLLRATGDEECGDVVHHLFEVLAENRLTAADAVLDAIRAIGLEVAAAGRPRLTSAWHDELLALDFHYPDVSGVTEEWQVRVNPAHLKNVRTWLALIEADPDAGRRLLGALVVHFKLGGVFVADTDLFQKDVSALLRSDVAPVYPRVKQLLRTLPVFFNDIGAEGELRELSTRLDELTARNDALCHFLRKQCHVESNPRLIAFTRAVARYWATGDAEPLRPHVPAPLHARLADPSPEREELARALAGLGPDGDPLGGGDPAELLRALEQRPGIGEQAREKARLLVLLHERLRDKYSLSAGDLIDRLKRCGHFPVTEVQRLAADLLARRHFEALGVILAFLERLQEIVLAPGGCEATEDIYHKRHVAAGIPSMYGRYLEEKFDAMGLTLRLEALAVGLFEGLFASENLDFMTRRGLMKVTEWLQLLLRALGIDGYRATGIDLRVSMLERALRAGGISIGQYINIFQFIAHAIKGHIRLKYLDVYEPLLDAIVPRLLERGTLAADPQVSRREQVLKHSEIFLRELIAQSFGLQQLDYLVGRTLNTLQLQHEHLDAPTLNLLMTYNVDRHCAPINAEQHAQDDVIYLGNKGYLLKRLTCLGHPVPHGFVITTEVFRCLPAIRAYDELLRDHHTRLERLVHQLEEATSRRYGEPDDPLLLSVRSGAAVSMPGMMDTFLNVGLNPDIVEGLGRRQGSAWFAWDCYRRFLQCWGMSFGLSREVFGRLMREAKERHALARKSEFGDAAMKELALRYREVVLENGVRLVDDPWQQLFTAIDQVLASWDSDKAKVYRGALKIADDWGSAVILQQMVFGNLSKRSGTGVIFTRHPRVLSEGVTLYGDFAVHSQGEDIVDGLVEACPITEYQRVTEARGWPGSLERDFPAIYQELYRRATALVSEHGMGHQEIEFTFESPDPRDLYILQTRDIELDQTAAIEAFVPGEELDRARVGGGVGVGGSALSGRAALTVEDIRRLREEHPGERVILLRQDTVPDDIALVSVVDGLLTALGGATSHAAVVAQRLGRTCVVGCRQLHVDHARSSFTIAGHDLRAGDLLSIDGMDGSVYLGAHPVARMRLPGLSMQQSSL